MIKNMYTLLQTMSSLLESNTEPGILTVRRLIRIVCNVNFAMQTLSRFFARIL